MTRRSWLAQSAHRTGAGPHADRRERRAESTRRQCREREIVAHSVALDAAYAEADAWHREREAAWLAAHPDLDPDLDPDAEPDYEREARERRP